MRWEKSGAENLLRLRAVAENGDWDDYHLFRLQQRHLQLYHSPFPTQNSLETQALELSLPTIPQPTDLDATESIPAAHQPLVELKSYATFSASSGYYALPLAV